MNLVCNNINRDSLNFNHSIVELATVAFKDILNFNSNLDYIVMLVMEIMKKKEKFV
jgi:hypothetical protein